MKQIGELIGYVTGVHDQGSVCGNGTALFKHLSDLFFFLNQGIVFKRRLNLLFRRKLFLYY